MSAATPSYERIAFVASPIAEAQEARRQLAARYGDVAPQTADVIVALGGDGLMLQTLHTFMHADKPIYGMHRGTVGFLMNEYQLEGLRERLAAAHVTVIHPLLMCARDHQRRRSRVPCLQRGVAVPPDLSGGAAAHPDRRQGAARRTRRRRRAARDAGRIDRLQSLRPGTDHPDQRLAHGAHADQPVPAAALARRAAAGQRARAGRGAGAGQAPGRRGRRPRRGARRAAWSTSRWTTRSRPGCCSIPATASTSASCASSSDIRNTG